MKKKLDKLTAQRQKRQKEVLTKVGHRVAWLAAMRLKQRGWEDDEIGDLLADAIRAAMTAIVKDLGTNGEVDPATGWWTEGSVRRAINESEYAGHLADAYDGERQTA